MATRRTRSALTALAFATAALAASYGYLARDADRERQARDELTRRRLFAFSVEDVLRGELRTQSATVTFSRDPRGRFWLDAPRREPASQAVLEHSLATMGALLLRQVLTDHPTPGELVEAELEPPRAGLQVTTRVGEDLHLLIGRKNPLVDGVYVTDAAHSRLGVIDAALAAAFDRTPEELSAPSPFAFAPDDVLVLEVQSAQGTLRLERTQAIRKTAGNQPVSDEDARRAIRCAPASAGSQDLDRPDDRAERGWLFGWRREERAGARSLDDALAPADVESVEEILEGLLGSPEDPKLAAARQQTDVATRSPAAGGVREGSPETGPRSLTLSFTLRDCEKVEARATRRSGETGRTETRGTPQAARTRSSPETMKAIDASAVLERDATPQDDGWEVEVLGVDRITRFSSLPPALLDAPESLGDRDLLRFAFADAYRVELVVSGSHWEALRVEQSETSEWTVVGEGSCEAKAWAVDALVRAFSRVKADEIHHVSATPEDRARWGVEPSTRRVTFSAQDGRTLGDLRIGHRHDRSRHYASTADDARVGLVSADLVARLPKSVVDWLVRPDACSISMPSDGL